MKAKQISAVILSLTLGTVHFCNVLATEQYDNTAKEPVVSEDESTVSGSAAEAEINLTKETESIISSDLADSSLTLDSLITRVNRIQTYTQGGTVENAYLRITPTSEISYGDTITLNFTNAVVIDDLEAFEDAQYTKSYDTLISQYLAIGTGSSAAKTVLNMIWANATDDVYIPWKLTKLSDTSVQAELFPIPEEYCNVTYNSYGQSGKPYYYMPLSVQVSNIGTADVSVTVGDETGSSLCFAYVVENEGDDISAYITDKPDGNYTRIKYVGNSLNLYALSPEEVQAGDSIILYYENASFPDDLPAFEDYQYTASYDTLYAQYTAYGSTSSAAKMILDSIWSDGMDDAYIPWKMTKLSDTSIEVDLFPLPSTYADTYYTSSGFSSKPYYYLPLEMEADEDAEVNLIIYHNGSTIYGGKLYDILGDVGYELLYSGSSKGITGYTGKPVDVDIPSKIDGESVTAINGYAFKNCEWLNSVAMADSITNIYLGAFYGCENLTSVTLSDNLTSIGESAFRKSGLTSITIPKSVTSIEFAAFYGCSDLTRVTILSTEAEIDSYAFKSCSSLEYVYCYEGSTADDSSLYPDDVTIVYLTENTVTAGDVNGDGNVNRSDLILMR
ncbi:MAG: leucine-rich repeat domain-containing protein, partial [Clostridiales bacterium]|nr:leucine-rich repeat domain-containing protein [Clostridiales bacterium]